MLGVGCGLSFTGGSLNPFRSFAPALFEALAKNKTALEEIWVYLIGPFAGGALAGVVYDLIFK